MTSYTKEQREMIAEFIEKEILTMRSMVNAEDINEIIKNLKFTRFAEIKNLVGTRFVQRFSDNECIIAYNQTSKENIVINMNKSLAFGVDTVSDDTLVEVINETSSN